MNQQTRRGFSLVELLVVMFIISMITTVALANYRAGEKRRRLAIAADTVISALTTAQNVILSGRQIPDLLIPFAGVECVNDKSIASASITIDVAQSYVQVLATDNCNATFELERINFVSGTRIKAGGIAVANCDPATCAANPASIEVIFYPPFATIKYKSALSLYTFSLITITLEPTDGSNTHSVLIDGVSGRISQN